MADYGGLAEEIVAGYEERKAFVATLLAESKKEDQERAVEVSRLIASFKPEDTERVAEVSRLVASFKPEDTRSYSVFDIFRFVFRVVSRQF